MKMTLGQLVEGALSEADQQLKLASAMDVHLPSGDSAIKIAMDDMDEGDHEDEDKKKAKKKDEDDDEEEEKTSALEDAAYAQELAEALGHIQVMIPKLASEMPTFAGQHNVGDKTQDTTTSAKTVPAAQASHGGGGSEAVDGGSSTGIETNKADYKSPDWTGNPEAKKGATRTSGVHPGETPAKTAALKSALTQQALLLQAAGAKVAADPSSPQPKGISTTTNPGKLDMVPGGSSAVPDNMGMASMTKRKAKTQYVKNDAAKVLREPAFDAATDKGLRDNLAMGLETAKIASDDKVKLAARRALLTKIATGQLGTEKQAAFRSALDRHRNQKIARLVKREG